MDISVWSSLLCICSFWVCQGPYDPSLVRAWEDWDAKHGSENDHPNDFANDQVRVSSNRALKIHSLWWSMNKN
jgi:hypothetical protein